MYIYIYNAFGPGGKARIQDVIPASYMDIAFVLLVHEGSEIWTNRSLQVSLLQLQHN